MYLALVLSPPVSLSLGGRGRAFSSAHRCPCSFKLSSSASHAVTLPFRTRSADRYSNDRPPAPPPAAGPCTPPGARFRFHAFAGLIAPRNDIGEEVVDEERAGERSDASSTDHCVSAWDGRSENAAAEAFADSSCRGNSRWGDGACPRAIFRQERQQPHIRCGRTDGRVVRG